MSAIHGSCHFIAFDILRISLSKCVKNKTKKKVIQSLYLMSMCVNSANKRKCQFWPSFAVCHTHW